MLSDLREALYVLSERPYSTPVVEVEELDNGWVHGVVWGHSAEEVWVFLLVGQHWGGGRKGKLQTQKDKSQLETHNKTNKQQRIERRAAVAQYVCGSPYDQEVSDLNPDSYIPLL